MTTKYASRSDVKSEASKMPDEFLACRDLGHTWRQYRIVKVRGGYNRDLYCPTCKTARHEFISRGGEKLGVHYTYPDGYQMKGLGRVLGDGRNAMRLESLGRALDKAIGETGEARLDLRDAEGEPVVEPVPGVRTTVTSQEETEA